MTYYCPKSNTLITPNIGNRSLVYNGDEDGRALGLRNPSADFIMNMPSTGYKNLSLKFAVTQSVSRFETFLINYSMDGLNFIETNINLTTLYDNRRLSIT